MNKYKEIILSLICLIIIFVLIFPIAIMVQTNMENEFNEGCNKKYGKDNWEIYETTGKYWWYIGQTWDCMEIREEK